MDYLRLLTTAAMAFVHAQGQTPNQTPNQTPSKRSPGVLETPDQHPAAVLADAAAGAVRRRRVGDDVRALGG